MNTIEQVKVASSSKAFFTAVSRAFSESDVIIEQLDTSDPQSKFSESIKVFYNYESWFRRTIGSIWRIIDTNHPQQLKNGLVVFIDETSIIQKTLTLKEIRQTYLQLKKKYMPLFVYFTRQPQNTEDSAKLYESGVRYIANTNHLNDHNIQEIVAPICSLIRTDYDTYCLITNESRLRVFVSVLTGIVGFTAGFGRNIIENIDGRLSVIVSEVPCDNCDNGTKKMRIRIHNYGYTPKSGIKLDISPTHVDHDMPRFFPHTISMNESKLMDFHVGQLPKKSILRVSGPHRYEASFRLSSGGIQKPMEIH